MGKHTSTKPQKPTKSKTSTRPHKPQPQLPPTEVFPQYENDDDVPVFDPENMQANIRNQNKLKKKKKRVMEPEPEPEPEYEPEPEVMDEEEEGTMESPEIDVEDIEKEIEMEGEQEQEGEGEQEGELEVEEEHMDGADIQGQPQPEAQPPKDLSMNIINTKIQQILSILSNFSALSDGRPRRDYLHELKGHLRTYYDYNDQLIDHLLTFLNPNQLVQFMQSNQTQRPLTIRVNTLKTRRKQLAQALIQRGVNLDPLAEWSKVGIKIYQSRVPIGATPEYLSGHYMLQSASSLLPVMALDARPGERVLDMAAAPGGKTTYIAQTMKNTGVVVANDSKKERLRALQFNLQRLGVSNTIVTNYDGRKMTKVMNNFDRVLLDAPCTGLGIISKDPSIKAQKLLIDIQKHSHLQKQLLLSAIDCCKPNGIIVYSTCSVSPLENEQVVNYALRKRFVKVVDIEQFEVGEPGITKYVNKRYHQQIQKTRRIYPHTLNMDGFYVARMVKVSNGEKRDEEGEGEGKEGENVESLGVEEEGKQQQSERKRDRKKNKGEAPKVETPAQEVRKVKQDTVEQIKSQKLNKKQKEQRHVQQTQQPIQVVEPVHQQKPKKKAKIQVRGSDSPMHAAEDAQPEPKPEVKRIKKIKKHTQK